MRRKGAAVAELAGVGPCLACGESIPYKVTDGGALSVGCPWCDFSGYAKRGTQAQAALRKRMKAAPAEEPAPAAAAPAAPKKPAAPSPAAPAKAPTLSGLLIG